LTTLPNIIHSDYQGETISSAEGKSLRKAIGATEDDTIVLVGEINKMLLLGPRKL
jgi:hypothetical protein